MHTAIGSKYTPHSLSLFNFPVFFFFLGRLLFSLFSLFPLFYATFQPLGFWLGDVCVSDELAGKSIVLTRTLLFGRCSQSATAAGPVSHEQPGSAAQPVGYLDAGIANERRPLVVLDLFRAPQALLMTLASLHIDRRRSTCALISKDSPAKQSTAAHQPIATSQDNANTVRTKRNHLNSNRKCGRRICRSSLYGSHRIRWRGEMSTVITKNREDILRANAKIRKKENFQRRTTFFFSFFFLL